jgi:hypothetical protein
MTRASSTDPIESLSDGVAITAFEGPGMTLASSTGPIESLSDEVAITAFKGRPARKSGDNLSAFLRTNRIVYLFIIAAGLRRELVVEQPEPTELRKNGCQTRLPMLRARPLPPR